MAQKGSIPAQRYWAIEAILTEEGRWTVARRWKSWPEANDDTPTISFHAALAAAER